MTRKRLEGFGDVEIVDETKIFGLDFVKTTEWILVMVWNRFVLAPLILTDSGCLCPR